MEEGGKRKGKVALPHLLSGLVIAGVFKGVYSEYLSTALRKKGGEGKNLREKRKKERGGKRLRTGTGRFGNRLIYILCGTGAPGRD